MNKQNIEHQLRHMPAMQPPKDLLPALIRDVTLPRVGTAEGARHANGRAVWTRRWLPAIGFAAWFLGCIVVFGYQASRINQLTRQQASANERAAAGLPHSSGLASTTPPTQPEATMETSDELLRLRAEIEQLRKDVSELGALRDENTRLRAELKAQVPPAVRPEQDFFAVQQEKASRIQCINHLKQLALAAQMEARDLNAGVLTRQLSSLTPYLKDATRYLYCSDGKTPYQLLSPGVSMSDPRVVFVRCPVHNNVALVDGSAHQLSPEQKLVDTGAGIHLER